MTNLIKRIALATALGLAACTSKTPQSNEGNAYDYPSPIADRTAPGSGYHYKIDASKPTMVEEDTAAIRADSIKEARLARADSIREARLERTEFLTDSLWEHGCFPYTRLVFRDEEGQVQTYDNLKRILTKGPNYIVFMKPDGKNEYTRSGPYDFIKGCEQDILENRDDVWAGRNHK